jgi:phage terminase large subunit-like protein
VAWVEEFIEYCASFPDAEFDDDVDALTQALQYIEQIPSSAPPLAVGNGTRWLK